MLAILPTGLLGCGTASSPVEASTTLALTPAGIGCSSTLGAPTGPTRVPLRVERTGGRVRVLIPVCVDGKGPYPFVLDTGAPSTVVDTQFLDYVHLPPAAPVTLLGQPGCTTVVLHVSVTRWSIGPVPLVAQSASAVRMPGFGLKGQPMGVLGSDVLSHFGAVRIDYRAQLLTVPGPEAQSTAPVAPVNSPTGSPVPPGLVGAGSRTVLPLDVSASASGTSVLTPVRLGVRGPFQFDVATGATASAVTAPLAAQLGLVKTGASLRVTSFGCIRNAPLVRSGPWTIGSVPLRPQQMVAAVAAYSSPVADGTVGSDALSGFGSVVLDYRSGALYLGAGSSAT